MLTNEYETIVLVNCGYMFKINIRHCNTEDIFSLKLWSINYEDVIVKMACTSHSGTRGKSVEDK